MYKSFINFSHPLSQIMSINDSKIACGNKITIRGKRAKFSHNPDVIVVDVTSTSSDKIFRQFSPFTPYRNSDGTPAFEVPFIEGKRSYSVEGVWQGLKIIKDKTSTDYCEKSFENTSMKELKRKGNIRGHFAGEGKPLLNYLEARKQIYLPAYTYMLDNYCQDGLDQLFKLHQQYKELVLLDYAINEDVEDLSKPLSHAALVKKRLLEMAQQCTSTSNTLPHDPTDHVESIPESTKRPVEASSEKAHKKRKRVA